MSHHQLAAAARRLAFQNPIVSQGFLSTTMAKRLGWEVDLMNQTLNGRQSTAQALQAVLLTVCLHFV